MTETLLDENVTSEQSSQYIDREFDVTVLEGTKSLHLDIQVNQPIWLTCMIYDTEGNLRGQLLRAGASGSLLIHEQAEYSSPYTNSGTIQPGNWMVNLTILKREPMAANEEWCHMKVQSNSFEKNEAKPDALLWQKKQDTRLSLEGFDSHQVFQQEKKWYKGDFHTHTIYSDGEMTREENIEMANKQSLDFFVATDHNIIPTSWYDSSNILVIPGTEVTSTLGHFNIINLNTSPFVKNRIRDMYDEKGTNEIIAQDYGDAIVSINHPFLKGCPWIYRDTNMDNIDTIEIINDPTYPDNLEAIEHALTAWNLLLNDGYKITGIGGSDSHLRPDDHYDGSSEPSLIGDPGTYVYCDELTASNLMNSVRKGYVTVSRGGFISITDGECLPGETSNLCEGKVFAEVDTDDNIYIEWIVDGEKVKTSKTKSDSYSFDFNESTYHWVRVDIRYPDGRLYGFTNPIYFGKKQPKIKVWDEILQKMGIKVPVEV